MAGKQCTSCQDSIRMKARVSNDDDLKELQDNQELVLNDNSIIKRAKFDLPKYLFEEFDGNSTNESIWEKKQELQMKNQNLSVYRRTIIDTVKTSGERTLKALRELNIQLKNEEQITKQRYLEEAVTQERQVTQIYLVMERLEATVKSG